MLFAKHPCDAGSVEGAGADLLAAQVGLGTVSDALTGRSATAAEHVQGQLDPAVRTVAREPATDATNLGRAAVLASGVLTSWLHAVQAFDATVQDLNQRWEAAAASDFGVATAEVPADAQPAEARTLRRERDDAVASARAELLAQLRIEHAHAEDVLETAGESAAATLAKGPTDDALEDLFLTGALPAWVVAGVPGIDLTDAELADLKARLEREGRLADVFAPPPLGTPSGELGEALDLARRMGVDPVHYADLLQQYYVSKAAEKAGIDLRTWDVTQGAAAVRDHYERTYEYYARLYLDHPYMRWAGMASMIGPSFAGGFEDLDMVRDLAQFLSENLDDVPLRPPLDQLDELANLGDDELAFYQQTFLQMQKDIFYDASMMHEAYLEGGLDSIQELKDAGLLDRDGADGDQALGAWRAIDRARTTGDTDLLDEGNTALLYREQRYTIDEQYQDMREHSPTGELFTYVLGAIGTPSIPGAQSLGEVDGLSFDVDTSPLLPGVQGGTVHTNLPEGNIADFEDRWGLIEDDTLPAYLDLVENHPDQVEEILTQDVRDRIDEHRLNETWDDVLATLGDVDVEGRLW